MDKEGYPEDDELDKIKNWDHGDDWLKLMRYVKSLWTYPEYFQEIIHDEYNFRLVTCGWSGNEDIIRALQGNHIFWLFCWYQSTVGGEYKFRVKEQI